jgi:hypothetical protein
MTNIAPLYEPLGEGFALRPGMELTNEALALVNDTDDADPTLKRCRSLKPGPQGCNSFRWNDTDYCKRHYDMIAAEGNL